MKIRCEKIRTGKSSKVQKYKNNRYKENLSFSCLKIFIFLIMKKIKIFFTHVTGYSQ